MKYQTVLASGTFLGYPRKFMNVSLGVSVVPPSIPHNAGENYPVVYALTAPHDAKGIYSIPLTCPSDMDIAVGLNSSQISSQDIPVFFGMGSCSVSSYNSKITGFANATVEYLPAISN